MSELFDTARSSFVYYIGNIFKEDEIDKNTSVEIFDRSTNTASRPPMYYNLDVIISVGYREKSKRGIRSIVSSITGNSERVLTERYVRVANSAQSLAINLYSDKIFA